jgi:hypothetical protein
VLDDGDLTKVEAGLVAAVNALIAEAADTTAYALEDHDHEMADISGLSAALSGKAASNHTHPTAEVTDLLSGNHVWAGRQSHSLGALVVGTDNSLAWNVAAAQTARHVLTAHSTLDVPGNMTAGTVAQLILVQDAVGGWTLSSAAAYQWAGGSAPEIATDPGAATIVTVMYDGSGLYALAVPFGG